MPAPGRLAGRRLRQREKRATIGCAFGRALL